MSGSYLRSSLFRIPAWSAVFGSSVVLFGMLAPVTAQKRSPEIRAQEEKDPAAGEVVIINPSELKKRKAKAPNPYAPIKLKPLPAAKPKATRNADNAPKKVPARRIVRKAKPKTFPIPPLPQQATETVASRTQSTRPKPTVLRRLPAPIEAIRSRLKERRESISAQRTEQAALQQRQQQEANRKRDEAERRREDQRRLAAREAERRDALAAEERALARRHDAERKRELQRQREAVLAERRRAERREQQRGDGWHDGRGYQDRHARYNGFRGRRPWRLCRRLAWGCRDGYSEACFRWRQRCTY